MEKTMRFDLDEFIQEARQWIRDQRHTLRPHGDELYPDLRSAFADYFEESILREARLCYAPTIPNPSFYAKLEQRGKPIPQDLDFRRMGGITFDDTILIVEGGQSDPEFVPLVFHELVHVVQYKKLGIDEFVTQYLNGWERHNHDYLSIPLESEAYRLQRIFERGVKFRVR